MDEKLRILKMVEEGTITAQQAADLMNAMGVEQPQEQLPVIKSYDKKMFRILVDAPNGDNVNIQFPVGAVKKILKATGQIPMPQQEMEGIDVKAMMEAVSECLDEKIEGDFVNVTAADGTKVRIFVDK